MIPIEKMTEKDLVKEKQELETKLAFKELTYELAGRLYEIRKALRRIESVRNDTSNTLSEDFRAS